MMLFVMLCVMVLFFCMVVWLSRVLSGLLLVVWMRCLIVSVGCVG